MDGAKVARASSNRMADAPDAARSMRSLATDIRDGSADGTPSSTSRPACRHTCHSIYCADFDRTVYDWSSTISSSNSPN